MFPSRRRTAIGALLTVATAAALNPSWSAAQDEPGAAASEPSTAEVRDLTLPVLDLSLATSSLDGSVRRIEGRDEVRVTLAADVLFEFNRANLTRRAGNRIEQVADEIRRAPPGAVTVEGHTDSKGTSSYNVGLSRRRAEAVRAVLERSLGASGPQLVTSGKGESRPVVANTKADGSDSPRGRARNRRVEIRIPKG